MADTDAAPIFLPIYGLIYSEFRNSHYANIFISRMQINNYLLKNNKNILTFNFKGVILRS